MAYIARVSYTANGSTDTFSFSFNYISTSHVKAYVDGTEDTSITFPTASSVQLSSTPSSGAVVLIKRVTPTDARLVDFQDGSVLSATDLDKSADQNFYVSQETSDNVQSKLGTSDSTNQYDAGSTGSNLRITNVANPTGDQDVATKHYLENTWLSSANKTALTTVNDNIANINAVNSNSSNINSAVSNATNINTVATNISSVNTVATDITKVVAVANDLAEAVSEVETVADDLNEATSEIDTVAQNIANVNTVGTDIANINTVAGISANVTTVAGISANVTTVAGMSSDITTVNSNSSNINTVAGSISNINTVAGSDANISTVASNISGVNSFADRYRISSSAPSTSLDVGDLYFDTTADELKVYKSSGWAAAGSTVNGTSQRYEYIATADQTTFTGADENSNTLAYDSPFCDVYMNGVRLVNGTDVTVTSGTSAVLTTGASVGDRISIVAYGTFNVAAVDGSAITTGTIGIDRIPSITNAKLAGSISNDKLAGSIANDKLANYQITINGSAVALGGSVTVGETKPTATGCTPSTITNDATNVVIAGTNFTSIPQVWAINTSTGIWYTANSVTYTSATSITANFTLLVDASYKIRVENPDGNAALSSTNILTVSDEPTWSTSSGSLGTIAGDFSGTVATVAATSDSAITYSEVTSGGNVLTNASHANCALNSSTGAITTSDFGGSSTTATLYTFTIRATDDEGQTVDREFTLQSSFSIEGSGGFN